MATRPREWPNNMKRYRDRAAEETQAGDQEAEKALVVAERLYERVQRGEFTRRGLERDLLYINRKLLVLTGKLNKALRHLEKAGAATDPQ